jgi:hypothetical protein
MGEVAPQGRVGVLYRTPRSSRYFATSGPHTREPFVVEGAPPCLTGKGAASIALISAN